MAFAKSLSALLVMLVISAASAAMGDQQDKFSDGSGDATITFPEKGGQNSSLSIELPRHITVNSAYVDLEGRPKSYASSAGFLDFSAPSGSLAYDGTQSSLPPTGKPNTLEGNNITLDAGLQSSDDRRTPAKAPNSVPYHLFEFDMGEVQLDNFDFMWEGMGSIYPSSGKQYSVAELYVYDCATGAWDLADSYDWGGVASSDCLLHAKVSTGASGYPDSRALLCFMVTIPVPASGTYTGYMESDYAALWYNGTRVLYPENLKLDLKGDGSVEWQKAGRLRGAVNFSGNAFANALQAILDASSPGTVRIPLKFTSDKGGLLFVSNLSILYDLRNLPPGPNGTVPRLFMDEDTNASALLDLWDWFKDDSGAAALQYSIVYEQDPGKLHAAINPDGHHVDLYPKEANWYGNERFRAQASDIEDLTAQIDFNVTVLSVNDPPRLKGAGTLSALQGIPFGYTFTATDVDYGVDPEETLRFSTNSTLLALDAETGEAAFTPQNADVGTHLFNVTVTDHYGASDTRNFTLRVDNINDRPSIEPVLDQTATEDRPFELHIIATDPDLALGMDELTFEDQSPLFAVSQNGTIAFTPLNKDVGEHQVSVSVTDLGGLKAYANFTLTVLNVNDPPRLAAIADQTVEEDKELSVRAVATDEDAADTLIFSTDDPLVKINATGWMTYRPTQKEVGLHRVNVTVADAAGERAVSAFNITVLNVNDPPRDVRILGPANLTVFRQGALVNFTGNATDDDGDALEFTWYSGDDVLGTGASFSTKELGPGLHTITLKADDGSGPVASKPVQITVEKKKTAAPAASKGFIPGFGLAALAAALALACLVARKKWA
jgi:hypothetical protein